MEEALRALNQLVADGVIRQYAIGGAIGAAFYIKAAQTEDIDAFIFLPPQSLGIVLLTPIYEALTALGGVVEHSMYALASGFYRFFPMPTRSSLKPSSRLSRYFKKRHCDSCLPTGTPVRHCTSNGPQQRPSASAYVPGTGSGRCGRPRLAVKTIRHRQPAGTVGLVQIDEAKTALNARVKQAMDKFLRSKSWEEKIASIERMNVADRISNAQGARNERQEVTASTGKLPRQAQSTFYASQSARTMRYPAISTGFRWPLGAE